MIAIVKLRSLFLLIVALGAITVTTACHTADGLGQDIEQLGESVQNQ